MWELIGDVPFSYSFNIRNNKSISSATWKIKHIQTGWRDNKADLHQIIEDCI